MKKYTLYSLIILLAFSFTNKCLGQWTSNNLLNTVISDVPVYEEATPLQASTSDGKTFISYFESSTSGYLAKVQLLYKSGNKLFGPNGLLVSNNPQNSALYIYDLKIDLQDNAILAFQDERNGNLSIFAYKIDTLGTEIWGANGVTLHVDTATFEVAPNIGILSNNDVIIAWNASGNGSGKYVPYQKISSSGQLGWSVPKIITGSLKQSRPSVLGISNQDFIVVFVQETGNFPGLSTIKAQRFDSNGINLWLANTTVSNYTTGFAAYPSVVSDNLDGCYVGFDTGTPGNSSQNDVFIQHITSSGATGWTTNGIEASSLPTNNKNIRKLTFRSSDNHLYVLMKVLDSGQSLSGAYAQAMDTTGAKLLTNNGALIVPISSAQYTEPYDWTDAGDGFITLYAQGPYGNNQMNALKMDYTGALTWTNKNISGVASNKSNASSSNFNNGQVVFVWEDERNDRGIYAQNIGTAGVVGIATGIKTLTSILPFTISTFIADKITINSPSNELYNFSLFAIDGKLVYNRNDISGKAEIEIPNLNNGSYVYKINSEQNTYSGNIVKVKK